MVMYFREDDELMAVGEYTPTVYAKDLSAQLGEWEKSYAHLEVDTKEYRAALRLLIDYFAILNDVLAINLYIEPSQADSFYQEVNNFASKTLELHGKASACEDVPIPFVAEFLHCCQPILQAIAKGSDWEVKGEQIYKLNTFELERANYWLIQAIDIIAPMPLYFEVKEN